MIRGLGNIWLLLFWFYLWVCWLVFAKLHLYFWLPAEWHLIEVLEVEYTIFTIIRTWRENEFWSYLLADEHENYYNFLLPNEHTLQINNFVQSPMMVRIFISNIILIVNISKKLENEFMLRLNCGNVVHFPFLWSYKHYCI